MAFTNTNEAKDAQRELSVLCQEISLDKYVAKFKQLAHAGKQPFTKHRTIEQFKLGLKGGLLDAIIKSDSYNPNVN
jgi:hypothetical protein